MLKQKSKKIDPKVRFQNRDFKQRLWDAKNYKRDVRRVPEPGLKSVLHKVRLDSLKVALPAILALLFLVYLIFVPNFLFVKNVEINGLKSEERERAQKTVNDYLRSQFWWPQGNILLLSRSGLAEYLLANNESVLKVREIKKKLPNSLILELEPRYAKYEVEIGDSRYALSNDGIILSGPLATTTAATLPLIRLEEKSQPSKGEQYFDVRLLELAEKLSSALAKGANIPINHISLASRNSEDVSIYTVKGYRVIFDARSDIADTIKKLRLLLTQISDSDKARLFYVDMRIKDKGYVCYKDMPCVKEIMPAMAVISSTTPAEMINNP